MMHEPPHPGESIQALCLEPLGLSVTKAAAHLGVSRKHLSEIVNGRAGISPEMAIRLSKAFGSTPEAWLRLQMQYELWHASRKADEIRVTRLRRAA
jgi:addiction module HigA family antidote